MHPPRARRFARRPRRFLPAAFAVLAFAPGVSLSFADHGHDPTAMSDEAMRRSIEEWFRVHPEHGRASAPSAGLGAPVDTFLATASPQFRFDTDGNLATTQDSVTIFVGEAIHWLLVNGAHTVTSGIPGQPDAGSLFNVSLSSLDPDFTFTFDSEGRFPFFCSPHSSTMRGVVKVQSLVGVEPLPLGAGAPAVGFVAPPAPNPARTFVIARFALDRAGRARLDVVDARGRRVARLVNLDLGVGGYAVRWDRGTAPAGVYFLRLSVPGASRSARVTFADAGP